ncbi:MAG: Glu-tRNA(Gln) amidotransferase subunit GatD [Candidatus Altiarchaeota archaeon]|nr:Glu-tRNA(Gln) amidotransferase subunit GatD [Candidatus Altiarchaeota archaeon]
MDIGGKFVELVLNDGRVLKGYVLPSTDFSDLTTLVIKLGNGYNIGVSQKQIKSVKELKKSAQKKTELVKRKSNKPAVSIIGTGGTIASRVDYVTGGVKASMTPDEIVSNLPEIADIASISMTSLMNKLSEDMVPTDWVALAKQIEKESKKSRGVVVFHGTDTMHYTSSMLSFMLDTSKPVVLTGAQRSSDRPSSDAAQNILTSLHAAQSDIAELSVCFHGTTSDDYNLLIAGTRARKAHSSKRAAFESVSTSPFARIWLDGKIEKLAKYRERSDKPVKADTRIDERVGLIWAYPGSDPSVIDWFVENGYKGLVIAGTGLGHVPVSPGKKLSWIPVIERYAQDIPIVMTSQTGAGRTHNFVYTNLRKASSSGAIFVEDMLSETAYTKLMWVLGRESKLDKIAELMRKSLKHEISKRTIRL